MPIGILIFVDQSSALVENSIEGPLKHADLCVTFCHQSFTFLQASFEMAIKLSYQCIPL